MPTVRSYIPDGRVLTEFFWDRSPLSIIQGPIGSGTSSACSHKIMKIGMEQLPDFDGERRTRWLIIRDTYPKLEKTTQRTWLDWFPEDQFGSFRRSVPPTHTIRYRHPDNDGTWINMEVIFHAIGTPEEAEEIAASFEITGFWVNEAQFVDKKVVDELLSRAGRYPSPARGPGAKWYGGMLDLNAPLEGHWIPYMRGDVPLPTDWAEDRRMAYVKPEGWTFFTQPPGLIERIVEGRPQYFENPEAENQKHLRQTYLQQTAGKDREWIDRRILNKTGLYTDGKPVYPTFSDREHVSQDILSVFDGVPLYVGLDFGRDPAAVVGQCVNNGWRVFAELIGDNEGAVEFAPRLKRWLSRKFPGRDFIFGGDPRGSDRSQVSNVTAYDIFHDHGMKVQPATSDNNPELRRNTVMTVLMRRSGLQIGTECITLRTGMAGGYHYPKIRGTGGFQDRPRKNKYSHVVEAFENMLIIGGEGHSVVTSERQRPAPVAMPRKRVTMRKFA
jgi:hypothetical protein